MSRRYHMRDMAQRVTSRARQRGAIVHCIDLLSVMLLMYAGGMVLMVLVDYFKLAGGDL